MSALETFLQHTDDCAVQQWWKKPLVCTCGLDEAENELAALRARITELEAALQPFAHEDFSRMTSNLKSLGEDSPVFGKSDAVLYLRDFRRARAVLNTNPPKQNTPTT